LVAPETSLKLTPPSRLIRHCRSGAVPVTATLKVALPPTTTLTPAGCVAMAGAITAAVTVRIAAWLGVSPSGLPTTAR
jgi:hypothetical protein